MPGKRRGKNEGGIYRRNDGTWIGAVTVGYENGVQKRRSVSGKTRADVAEKIYQIKADLKSQRFVKPSAILFGDYLDSWINKKRDFQKIKPSTLTNYSQNIENHIKPALGKLRIQKLTPKILNDFYAAKLSEEIKITKDRKKKREAKTVMKLHAIIRNALKHAVREGLVSRNVAEDTDKPKPKKHELSVLTEQQLRDLLEHAKTYPTPKKPNLNVYPIFFLELYTGLRRGELLGLKWSNVDLDNKTIRITETVLEVGGKLLVETPKTSSSIRTLAISDEVAELLIAHKEKTGNAEYVFPSHAGTPIHPRNLLRIFHALLDKANLPQVRFHDLRHAYASMLVSKNIHPRVIQHRLGHSDIRTTMNIYSHVLQEVDRDVANSFSLISVAEE